LRQKRTTKIEIAFQAPRQYLSVVIVIFTWVSVGFFPEKEKQKEKN
jgi:hypothetical protein